MKLWLKVSIVSVIMVTAALSILSLLILIGAGKSNLDYAIQSAVSTYTANAVYFEKAMQDGADETISATTQRSLARYYVSSLADPNIILTAADDVIYNTTSIDPALYLPLEAQKKRYIVTDIGEKSMLIVGNHISVRGVDYSFYRITDVTSIYTELLALSYRFSWISLLVILSTAALITLLVRTILSPIQRLKENTALIAAGVYDKRIAVAEPDEIGSLAMDFNAMVQAVETRVEELKEEAERRTLFMSALTHELKTPMTSIKGNAETLLMTKMDEEEREAALLQINADCTRVERLSYKLMQLLVLKRSSDIEPKKQKVSELLDMVYDAAKEQVRQRGLFLNIENHMELLKMDKDLLCELLLNLIDNAGKASPRGSTITLLAKDHILSVSDPGHGIPARELHRLTEPFYMVDKARSRKQGGMGLGLALAQEIARLHGAHLAFESEVGKGTTVKVVFENEKEAEK